MDFRIGYPDCVRFVHQTGPSFTRQNRPGGISETLLQVAAIARQQLLVSSGGNVCDCHRCSEAMPRGRADDRLSGSKSRDEQILKAGSRCLSEGNGNKRAFSGHGRFQAESSRVVADFHHQSPEGRSGGLEFQGQAVDFSGKRKGDFKRRKKVPVEDEDADQLEKVPLYTRHRQMKNGRFSVKFDAGKFLGRFDVHPGSPEIKQEVVRKVLDRHVDVNADPNHNRRKDTTTTAGGGGGEEVVRGCRKRKQANPRKRLPLKDSGLFRGAIITIKTLRFQDKYRLEMSTRYSGVVNATISSSERRQWEEEEDKDKDESTEATSTRSLAPGKSCISCGTSKTPLWRDAEDGTPLCNACGIRYKKYRVRCLRCWSIPRKEMKPSGRCARCGYLFRTSQLSQRSRYW